MIAKCQYCQCSFVIGEGGSYLVPCNGEHCQLDCDFELDYVTYPHGEELQVWSTKEEYDE